MQTAQLTFNDRTVYTEFFAVLFYSDVVKRTKPAEMSAIRNFSLFLGHFDVKNYASALYRAKNIRET